MPSLLASFITEKEGGGEIEREGERESEGEK